MLLWRAFFRGLIELQAVDEGGRKLFPCREVFWMKGVFRVWTTGDMWIFRCSLCR